MSNPVLVEVTRGDLVESRHRGALAILDADGASVVTLGDVARPVYPRSAVKALQALPLVESGAAEALDYAPAELALACSSHNGEPVHVNAARVMLMKAGLDEDALECGPQWPRLEADRRALHLAGEEPSPLHNNCSGKHAGFLGLARVMGAQTRGYVKADHPVQQEIRAVLEAMTGAAHGQDVCGIDGCSIPTFAVPLTGLARAFAVFATGEGLEAGRAGACQTLYEACTANPHMVAGTGRFCTDVMTAFGDRVFVKTGAEGVFCGAIPELGLGIALKCDDGGTRAAEAMMAGVISALLEADEDQAAVLKGFNGAPVATRLGVVAGHVRTVDGFAQMVRT
ncbi:asparaginase [Breoghania corrubedonensis]|uniref:Asparaginase n=1 Tax=Breoghania corrubedonensis TaxID=665038 RepID=A0A2T5UW54_9HYPH|nr:asparaginase [Breoghania corrubedonensis]PTW55743.1 asparaginase [Breoghania corrubedonensis]